MALLSSPGAADDTVDWFGFGLKESVVSCLDLLQSPAIRGKPNGKRDKVEEGNGVITFFYCRNFVIR